MNTTISRRQVITVAGDETKGGINEGKLIAANESHSDLHEGRFKPEGRRVEFAHSRCAHLRLFSPSLQDHMDKGTINNARRDAQPLRLTSVSLAFHYKTTMDNGTINDPRREA